MLKNREIVIEESKIRVWGWEGSGFGRPFSLCSPSLRRVLDIPKDVKKIVAVFSVEMGSDDEAAFTIKPPTLGYWGNDSKLVEFSGRFNFAAGIVLAAAYNIGYRYVEIQYEDNGE